MNNNLKKKAVVILSGGMDSTLSSYIAKDSGYELIAIHFYNPLFLISFYLNYKQKDWSWYH